MLVGSNSQSSDRLQRSAMRRAEYPEDLTENEKEKGLWRTTTYSSIRSLGLDVDYENFQETLEDCLD